MAEHDPLPEADSLFDLEELGMTVPPSPHEEAAKKRREQEAKRQQDIVRTQDERAASTNDFIGEWVEHVKHNHLSDTEIPTEIKVRVGRTVRSLIKKGYLYDEIVFALMTFTVKDFRDRKNIPRTGNLEIYARQYRGENHGERDANEAEQERLRQEALAQGQVPTTGTARQNQRDASILAIMEAAQEFQASQADRQIEHTSAPQREIGPAL